MSINGSDINPDDMLQLNLPPPKDINRDNNIIMISFVTYLRLQVSEYCDDQLSWY